jgi:hypothetical protein
MASLRQRKEIVMDANVVAIVGIGGTFAPWDPFGIPSTSHWTGAAITEQAFRRTKTYIVTRPRTSRRPMPSSLAG